MSAENFFYVKCSFCYTLNSTARDGRTAVSLSLSLSLSTHLRPWLYIRALEHICGQNIEVKQNHVKTKINCPINVLKWLVIR